MKKAGVIKLLVLLTLAIAAYIPTFNWMIIRCSAKDTYYSHSFLIPFISLFIVWTKKNRLSKLAMKPSNAGWLFFIPGILTHLITHYFRVSFVSGYSFIIVLIGLVLLCLGKDYLRELLFPILFLLFMVPAPELAITNLSFRLKLFAAQISTVVINKLGVPAIREGSLIRTAHSQIMVEDPCSGIRSLVALIALGALMAYFSGLSKPRKLILFISSVPIAVTTNIIRIVSLSLVSEIYGDKFATGFFHDTMGVLVFIFAFAGLAFIAKLLE